MTTAPWPICGAPSRAPMRRCNAGWFIEFHMVDAVEELIDRGEDRFSPEEAALLETMAILVQAYDDRHHPLPSIAPNEMLAYLMETSGRTAKELLPVFGTRGLSVRVEVGAKLTLWDESHRRDAQSSESGEGLMATCDAI